MNYTQGPQRTPIAPETARQLRDAGALVDGLERTLWMDGRFLTASDLNREQNYVLSREAQLGRAAGSGVTHGLRVSAGEDARHLVIEAGHGLTPSGELVVVQQSLSVDLADIPSAEQLSAKFGLARLPTQPARSRTGLFALALRPVEFTANPVGTYPTTLSGPRTVEHGDIVEATAIVLVPWPQAGAQHGLDQRRGWAARQIFAVGEADALPASVLPLAMLALDGNSVAWIDMPMLRRELGADRADLPGLGLAPRALRFAHLLQHQQHLAEVRNLSGNRPFAAASVFPALPPAGPLPPGVIDPADFTQRYFPATVSAEFTVIPEDELPALVEESLALPGFDLTADPEALASSQVLVLAPIPRHEWNATITRLETLSRAVLPAAVNQIAARKPLEIVMRLRVPAVTAPAPDPSSPSDAEWQRLAGLDTLWYVRRRNLAYREDLAGTAQRLAGRESEVSDADVERIESLGLSDSLTPALERATPAARAEITRLLATPRIAASPTLTAAAVGELSRAATLDQAAVLRTTAALTAPQAGSGLTRLDSTAVASDPQALARIASSGDWTVLDTQMRTLPKAGLSDAGAKLVTTPLSDPAPAKRKTSASSTRSGKTTRTKKK